MGHAPSERVRAADGTRPRVGGRAEGSKQMSVPATAPSVTDWVRSFTEANNTDPEIQAHGKYFTCSYLLDMTDHTFVVRMVSGKVADIAVDPGPLDIGYQFIVRASAETWRQFGSEIP